MGFKWYMMNPFVEKVKALQHEVVVVNSPYIDIAVLRPENCTGIEGNVIIFDEGGWVLKRLPMKYEGYRQARPMVASVPFKHIIHLSTPARATAFEEAWHSIGGIERK